MMPNATTTQEDSRLLESQARKKHWKRWGPYLSERAWGNLAFRLGIPVGSLAFGKLIPVVGISSSLAGSGISLIGIAVFFMALTRGATLFQRNRPAVEKATP